MHYRIRQFYFSLTANFRRLDEDFLIQHLTKNQLVLFLKLRRADAHHAIRVARALLESAPEGLEADYVKLGLLHDIGKVERPLALPEKVAAVLLHKALKEKMSRFGRIAFIDAYLRHAQRGRRILEDKSVFPAHPYLYSVVSDHHEDLQQMLEDAEKSAEYKQALMLLKEADDKN